MKTLVLRLGTAMLLAAGAGLGASGDVDGALYRDPSDLALTPDGGRLLVACAGSDSLLVLDLPSGEVRGEVATGRRPTAIEVDPDGRFAYVANHDDDTVSVVDLTLGRTERTLGTGWAPRDLVLDSVNRRLWVANSLSRDVSVVDLASGAERKRLRAGEMPHALALSPDGRTLYVTSLLPDPHPPEQPPATEVTVIDVEREVVSERLAVPGANLLAGVAAARDGTVLVPLVRPKNLVPLIHVAGGWTMTHGLGLLSPGAPDRGSVQQVMLDGPDRHFADPTAVVAGAEGRFAYVAAGGADRVLVVDLTELGRSVEEFGSDPYLADRLDLAGRFLAAEIATGPHPVALALAPDGRRLYVAERLGDSVTVVDTAGRRVERTFDLRKTGELTPVRRGEQLFYSAEATFHGQFSCASCHPAGRHDSLVYDISPDGLGRNFVDTRTLLGVRGTAPFKWSGLNPDLHTQCGPRAAKFIMRSPGFTPEELDDVVAYMAWLPLTRNRHRNGGRLTPLQKWGKEIYEREVDNLGQPITEANRCTFCHPPPRFTNNRAFDVGTRSKSDDSGLVDTPTLNNLTETAPFLHDGRAMSLEEIWTVWNPDDRHGRANDLGKDELNALVEYLKTL